MADVSLNVTETAEVVPPVTGARGASITAIILTYNEEVHIERCLSRVLPLVERVVVVDSYSSDRTVELAQALAEQFVAESDAVAATHRLLAAVIGDGATTVAAAGRGGNVGKRV